MGETIEKLEQLLQESRESQKRLLQQITEQEKQLKELEFHHRKTNQLLLSIIDMDTASGGDRASLRRHIKILTYIDEHINALGVGLSRFTLLDMLLALVTEPQEFGLPSEGVQADEFFNTSEVPSKNHNLDNQTALILAICIADIFAGLLSISEKIFLQAQQLKDMDRLRVRCLAGVSSRYAEEVLNQILQGSFFSLLQGQVSINFLPPNPQEGPGLELTITYGL